MRRELWWQTKAKDITPIAWIIPELMRIEPRIGPFKDESAMGP